jgi:hypothetical protein
MIVQVGLVNPFPLKTLDPQIYTFLKFISFKFLSTQAVFLFFVEIVVQLGCKPVKILCSKNLSLEDFF